MSRTAQDITGEIALSGLEGFPSDGRQMTITFQNGTSAILTQVRASRRNWSLSDPTKKITAEIFKLSRDPGTLENGNSLCGDAAVYLVFSDPYLLDMGKTLDMAVFSSSKPPESILDDGLCATFSYYDEAPSRAPD